MNDITLGSRFWKTQNTTQLANLLGATDQPAINQQQLTDRSKIKSDSGMASFVNTPNSEFVRTAINRAELFAASHTLSIEESVIESRHAERNAEALGLDLDALVNMMVAANPDKIDVNDDDAMTKYRLSLMTAMAKLMATQEVSDRAAKNIALSEDGKLALCNAALGLASMLREGTISEDAVLYLADGKFYDGANSADLLRLVSDSTKTIQEIFVQSKQLNETIHQCEQLLENLPPAISPQIRRNLEQKLENLRGARDTLIQTRQQLVNTLKTDYDLSDPTGKQKSDAKFQQDQLKQMRCILRAFRFDLDKAQDTFKDESIMTRFRRRMDNAWRTVDKNVHRITANEFQHARNVTTEFNDYLAVFKTTLMEVYLDAGQDVPLAAMNLHDSDMDAAANQAKELSHLTNDKLRYFFSGAEKKESDKVAELQAQLEPTLKRGGVRKASLEVGADFLLNIGASFADIDLKVGAKYVLDVEFSVPEGGGQISVTYSHGGKAFAMAKAQLGVDPELNESGFGALAKAEAEGGVARKYTKTYANIEEFVRDTGGNIMAFQGGIGGFSMDKVKRLAKGVYHLGLKANTAMGLRIHKTNFDNIAYNEKLRQFNVFGELDGAMLGRKNAVINARRTTTEFGGKASASANGGFYTSSAENDGKSSAAVDLNASGNFGISGEGFATLKTYQQFAKSLASLSTGNVRAKYMNELEILERGEGLEHPALSQLELRHFLTDLRAAVPVNPRNTREEVGQAMQSLMGLYIKLERIAIDHDKKDTSFWDDFTRLSRLFIGANALLGKEALAFEDGEKLAQASNEYLATRMGNPAVKIPADIFEKYLMKTKNYGAPPKLVVQGGFSFGYSFAEQVGSFDPLHITADEKVDNTWKSAGTLTGKMAANSFTKTLEDEGKAMAGLSHKVGVNVIYEKPLLSQKDSRPWVNDSSFTVDVNITASLAVRTLIDVIARAVVKQKGGKDEMENTRLHKEIAEQLMADLIPGAIVDGLTSAEPILGMTVLEAIDKSDRFKDLMTFMGVIPPKVKAEAGPIALEYGSTTDHLKTLRFKFNNWRFTSFSAVNTMNYSFTAGFNAYGPGLHFRYSSVTADVDYTVLPKPSPNALMGRVADLLGTGNAEALRHFLTRNKLGTMRLLHAAMELPRDDGDNNPGFQADGDDIRQKISTLDAQLTALAQSPAAGDLAEEARAIYDKLQEVKHMLDDMKANINANQKVLDSAKISLAKDLFSVMVQGFNLLQEKQTA